MNQTFQGDNGLINSLARFKGVLQGLFGTSAGGAIAGLVSTGVGIAGTIIGNKRNGLVKFIGQDSIVVHIPEDDYLITWSGKL